MGLYPVYCVSCGETFMWFSGNNSPQICEECLEIIKEQEKER